MHACTVRLMCLSATLRDVAVFCLPPSPLPVAHSHIHPCLPLPSQMTGTLSIGRDGTVSLQEKDGIDFAPVTVKVRVRVSGEGEDWTAGNAPALPHLPHLPACRTAVLHARESLEAMPRAAAPGCVQRWYSPVPHLYLACTSPAPHLSIYSCGVA